MDWVSHLREKSFYSKLYDKSIASDLFGRSAQVAFYFSFAFFPLLLFLVTLFGLILGSTESFQRGLYQYLSEIMPGSAFVLVRTTMTEIIAQSSSGKLTIGLFVTLWSASAGVDSLRTSLNSVYEVDEDRSWWKTKLQSLLMTFLFILLVGIALATVTAGINAMHSLIALLGVEVDSPWVLVAIQWLCLFAVMFFATSVLYSWLPNFKRFRWVWVSPGSVVAVILWLLSTGGFRLYLHYFNSYNKAYGSLGAVIILMLWMYLTGTAILVGGAINSVLTELSEDSGAEEAQKGQKEHAITEAKKAQAHK